MPSRARRRWRGRWRSRGGGSFPRWGCMASVSILLTARKTGLPPRRSRRASSRSGEASSVRPSTTMMMALASVERDLGLAEDFGGDEGFVVGDDAAGVDDAGVGAHPLDLAVDAVAGDAGLVADDGAAGAGEAIEEGGLADVGAAADGDEREVAVAGGRLSAARSSCAARSSASRQARRSAAVRRRIRAADVGGVRGLAADDVVGGAGEASCAGGLAGRWCGGTRSRASGWGCASSFRARRVLVARALRLRGSTAPVVGVTRGARPFLGRVDASRCFLPSRFLSSRCAMGLPSGDARAPRDIIGRGGAAWFCSVCRRPRAHGCARRFSPSGRLGK